MSTAYKSKDLNHFFLPCTLPFNFFFKIKIQPAQFYFHFMSES